MGNFHVLRVGFIVAVACLATGLAAAQSGEQPAEKIHFIQNDIEAAKAEAAVSKRGILAKFGAHWCLPCRMMDESVWPNPDLVSAVSKDWVALAVDVEDFDGFAAKEQFSVHALPTILLLDSEGRVLFKKEGSCGAGELLDKLEFYQKKGVKVLVAEADGSWMPAEDYLTGRSDFEPRPVVFSALPAPVFSETAAVKTASDGETDWPMR